MRPFGIAHAKEEIEALTLTPKDFEVNHRKG